MNFSTYNFRLLWIIYTSRKSKRPFGLVVYNWVMFFAVITPVIRTLVPIVPELLLGFSASKPIEAQVPRFRLAGHKCRIFIPTAVELSYLIGEGG